ncbi:MAG: glycoside hydrolase family 57 [Alphaproteobacteria bacterium]|nr:glycoside hydrolase family 57 [Alphaproteobacteria bacterium]MBL6939867.1 glycoside hydrolase family 57 [Alphaproteobacteria bacterium]MBL7098320.1 glycoside hydrolase family 57 [Alphaproteobacteria bacterium]
MNAPLTERDLLATAGTLQIYALFHLNLAFSSIEEEQRATVIEKCYWPLLRLAERFGPIGIEATAHTLGEIASRDPEWIGRARTLLERGRIELIGSGYSQMIGPLVPAKVTEANLRIGNDLYQRLLGAAPQIALVNEQAYSAGLVGLYLDAGYRALAMDWDNPGAAHPQWTGETRYLPQRALGADGRSIGLVWTNTVAFQKMQRFVHRDIEIDPYLEYVRGHRAVQRRALCVYASDAEIFDYRPGRYKTEEKCTGDEWMRMEEVFERLTAEFEMVAPSDVLKLHDAKDAGQTLRLETAAMPIPVKKQRKYNLARWAVTGRDDLGVNAACERIYRGMCAGKATAADWKELCWLWASDFRTHVTEKRWAKFTARLASAEATWSAAPSPAPVASGDAVESRHIDVATPFVAARLDRRRGLALSTVQFAKHATPVLGGLNHGHFDDIALQADWYTGDCVFEAPGEHKVTDLEWATTRLWTDANGDVCVSGTIATPKGPIEKTLRFSAHEPRIDFDLTFHWADWGKGSLRLGHVTLLGDAFDAARLSLTTHNGGAVAERFDLAGQTVEHGAPVSFLVSSSHGLGMTEGWAEIGDEHTRVRIEVDRETACLLGLLTHRISGGKVFCQLMLSALELDDTRRPCAYRSGPRRFRFSLIGVAA